MAIRFSSFEMYKTLLADESTGKVSIANTFLAGLGAGITESIAVVNPMEVVKIRLQAQRHSLMDPEQVPKYRNAAHAVYTIFREEGLAALYRGVTLTAARQATNQAVNFTLYQEIKKLLCQLQQTDQLPSYQHLLAGGVSGAIAPLCNAPIDTIKTRIQKQISVPGESGFERIRKCASNIIKNEGFLAFYNGLTPRLLRIAPGQAITFMIYEKISSFLNPLVQNKPQ
jgi:solute carrier family 25 citrate transporter 1